MTVLKQNAKLERNGAMCIFLRVSIAFISSFTWPMIPKCSWTVGKQKNRCKMDREESEAALRSLKSGARSEWQGEDSQGRVRAGRMGQAEV